MAIGSLSKWYQSTNTSLRAVTVPASQIAQEDAHYFQAVTYYCRALKTQSQRPSLQDAVFLSILSLFFEILRGNRKAALDHVNHGLALLLAVTTDAAATTNFAPDPRPVLGAVAEVFTQLIGQARAVLRGRVGQGPSLPHLVTGLRKACHTFESFMLLLSELPRGSATTASTAPTIPSTFRSLDEFEHHWTLSRRSQARMASIMAETMQASGGAPPGSQDEAALARFYDSLLSNARIRDFCAAARREMRALDAAFAPLFDRVVADAEPGDPAYLKALHLRLQYLGVVLFEDPPQYASVATVRARTPVFREYVTVAATALGAAAKGDQRRTSNPAARLSLQCGVAFNLCLLALFCRDPLVRDQAVGLLEGYPGQDGLWSTRALHALAARNRVVERANAVEGTDEERWRRLWRREMVFEEAGERVLLRYMDKDAESGEWRLVEEVAEVRAREEQVCWRRQPLTGSGAPLLADLYAFYSD
ncbi:hypothetical protein SLS58_001489 [Diplodia intermedia]|uniref:C6 zinc finger domain protein n=1 Tax=Diplodia intermedia TaxID=856260 RepID=A0ABR3U1B5_9PEZI